MEAVDREDALVVQDDVVVRRDVGLTGHGGRQVSADRAAERDVQELQAAADSEDRQVALDRRREQAPLDAVARL